MTLQPDICVEKSYMENGDTAILIKISSDVYELNIWIELSRINDFFSFIESGQRSFFGGVSADTNVIWSRDEDSVYVLIGGDEETWDIGFPFDKNVLKKIKSEIAAELSEK